MNTPKKCIIDNWSLEHAGLLLDNSDDLGQSTGESLIKNLGGLSNFINAILLYEDSLFLVNGFEKEWKRFSWFDQNTSAFIQGVELDDLIINWTAKEAYADKGIGNYLLTSRFFEADLMVCPERSDDIVTNSYTPNNSFFETLRLIDKKIRHERDQSAFSKVQIGVDSNFQLPSLTQYVLSEASNREDLLKVIMQLKTDGKIKKVTAEIETIISSTKEAGKFQNNINSLVKKAFGNALGNASDPSVGVSAFGIGISKTVDPNFFSRKDHLVFLKKLISCRTEIFKAEKDLQRVFKRKIHL